MKKTAARRPSPALVISILALFVALGGSAYAASKVGTKNIKKNAITAAKIKKNAVTTAKVKNNAITGAKVNEGSLGAVPRALRADSADSATNALNATNFKRFHTTGVVKVKFSNEDVIPIADGPGPFRFVGLCVDTDGGGGFASIVNLVSSQLGSFIYSPLGTDLSGGTKTPLAGAQIGADVTSGSPSWGKSGEFTAASADGSVVLQGWVSVGTHVFGADCAYNISYVEIG